MKDFLLSIFSGLFVGLITAWVSVHFALRKFRNERTWERKLQAYSELFDALFYVQRRVKVELEQVEEGATYNPEYVKALEERASEGHSTLRKAAVVGSFMFSDEATGSINRFIEALDDPHHNEDFPEELSSFLAAVTTLIRELHAFSKQDLAFPKR